MRGGHEEERRDGDLFPFVHFVLYHEAMAITLVEQKISREELDDIAEHQFGNLVKAVVDIERGVMAVGGELHADEEAFLLERGSAQKHLWGVNLYPAKEGADFIEFDSMINVRPSQGNASRGVEDIALQERIRTVVQQLTG